MATLSLTSKERLKKRSDFLYTYKNGQVYRGRHIALYALRNQLQNNRIGISISKKNIAKPTLRNRIKRRIKEFCRTKKPQLLQGFDLIFVITSPYLDITYKNISSTTKYLLDKAGLISKTL